MRVKQCCCGCSLRTGTLILLWLDLIGTIYGLVIGVSSLMSSNKIVTFLNYSSMTWDVITLMIIIYALVGVEKARPSYLVPYIGLCIVNMVKIVLFVLFIWIGSIALRDMIIAMYAAKMNKDLSSSHSSSDSYSDLYSDSYTRHREPSPQDFEKVYGALVGSVVFALLIGLALSLYFTVVVYSFYKQMVEEAKGMVHPGGGIIYAAPSDQPGKGAGVAYNDYPPAYGPQTGAYPPQNPACPPQNPAYPPQNPGYPPQNPVYPQLPPQQKQ